MKASASSAAASSATLPDEIPAVHVLVAAEDQERKETEDLLSAFDRPGRGPKRPSGGERDFVDYYSKKKGDGAASDRGRAAPPAGALPVALSPRASDESTVVRQRPKRSREGAPVWLGWVGAVVAMLSVGGVAAWVANPDVGRKAGAAAPPSAPTLTAGAPAITTTQPQAARSREDVPPPSPAEPSAAASAGATTTGATAPSGAVTAPAPVVTEPAPASTDPAPRASARKDARPPASAGAAPNGAAGAPRGAADPRANGDRKPPPRDDFIRDL